MSSFSRVCRWIGRLLTAPGYLLLLLCASTQAQSVLQYHGSADRAGNYVIAGLTLDHAPSIHLEQSFDGRIDGHIYAQPLVVSAAGHVLLLVATENNAIVALDARSGRGVWLKSVGQAVRSSMLRCGNIDPLGITGTPAIDQTRRAVYFDAMVKSGDDGPQHLVFGLSVDNGAVLPGFPVNVSRALAGQSVTFNAADQNQRGALLIMHNTLFIPYGGHYGDCGQYHGWVVSVGLDTPHPVKAWSTRAPGGGVWAPGGIVSDGNSIFFATGNTFETTDWGDGEAILRLAADLTPSRRTSDFSAPSDWRMLDRRDADLGGTSPLPLDLHQSGSNPHLILALGKDGNAYLISRDNLGGIGGALLTAQVADDAIITAPAKYSAPDGGMFVAVNSQGIHCPGPSSDSSLGALKVESRPTPAIRTSWCASLDGAGIPIVTTTDGSANPIVWIVGAEGDRRLHAFRGDNGASILTEPHPMQGLRHFVTIVATADHLYVPADGRIYSFTW